MLSTPAVGRSLWRCQALLLFARDGIQRVVAPPAPVGRPAGKQNRAGAGKPGPPSQADKRRKIMETKRHDSRSDGFSFPAQMAEVGGASISSQAAGAAGAVVSGASSAAGAKRRNQHCRTCGHKMRVGAFKCHHNQFLSSPGPICTVPESRRRVKVNPIATRPIRMFDSACHCVGDDAYPGGCSSK